MIVKARVNRQASDKLEVRKRMGRTPSEMDFPPRVLSGTSRFGDEHVVEPQSSLPANALSIF